MSINEVTSLDELFETAKLTIKELQSGEVFMVKDLFKGFEWNRIEKGYRTKLGSMFFAYAKKEGCNTLDCLGKTQQNQQKYQKK